MKPITKQNVLNYILIFRYNKLHKNKKMNLVKKMHKKF